MVYFVVKNIYINLFNLFTATLSSPKCHSCTFNVIQATKCHSYNYSLSTSKSVCLGVDGSNLPLNYGTFHVWSTWM